LSSRVQSALLDAKDAVATVQFIADHNYNRDSREAVYAWFGRWVLGKTDAVLFKEQEYDLPQPADLLVFFGRELPKEAKTQAQIVEALIEARKAQLAALRPRDATGLVRFREVLGPAYRHALAAEYPGADAVLEIASGPHGTAGTRELLIGRRGRGDRLPVRLWRSLAGGARKAVLVVHPDGIEGASAHSASLVEPLRRQGQLVASLDAFNTGRAAVPRDTSDRFFTTYNRTDDANRVQDILTTLAWLKRQPGVHEVSLVGLERAGLWCLLAQALAPELDAIVADADTFATERDEAYLDRRSLFSAAWAASRQPCP
jgi:dienelactone hydrolase